MKNYFKSGLGLLPAAALLKRFIKLQEKMSPRWGSGKPFVAFSTKMPPLWGLKISSVRFFCDRLVGCAFW